MGFIGMDRLHLKLVIMKIHRPLHDTLLSHWTVMRLLTKLRQHLHCVCNYRMTDEYKIAYFVILAAMYMLARSAPSQVVCVEENVSICYFEKAIWAGNCCWSSAERECISQALMWTLSTSEHCFIYACRGGGFIPQGSPQGCSPSLAWSVPCHLSQTG